MQGKAAALMISGSGRSGTTILSVLLTQGDGVLNIGQARDIWAGWAANVPCTCGKGLSDCALWGAVRQQGFAGWEAADFHAAEARQSRFMDAAAKLADWSDSAALDVLADHHADYLGNLRSLLQALLDQSGARLLVDSSKSPEIALAFHLSGLVDLLVLNMMRDPRAVAVSWARKKSGKIGGKMRSWAERQKRLAGWPEAKGLRHKTLRYEAFADHPEPVLQDILHWAGHDLPDGIFSAPRQAQVSWARQHLFPPSNETVLAEKREAVTIRAPQDWRSLRNWRLHAIALTRTFPAGLLYIIGKGRDHG